MLSPGPQNTFEKSYELLDAVYRDIPKEKKPVIIMGNSAGRELALGFAEYLKESGMPHPEKMILIAPWVDVTPVLHKFSQKQTKP